MGTGWTRRELMRGSAVALFAGFMGPWGISRRARAAERLRAVHLSDFHWGYRGPWNRHPEASLRAVLERVRGLSPRPDLMLVTGDLIQATPESSQRRERFQQVKSLLDSLAIPWVAVPGEHDTFGDGGAMFEELIGPRYYHRTMGPIHIFGLDNVSRGPLLEPRQVSWFRREIQGLSRDSIILVLSHAPLFSLFIPWNWYTYNGTAIYHIMRPYAAKQFLYGHIHQACDREYEGMNRSGLPTAWPLPEPGPLVRLEPWPQGATHPDMGLGFRVLDWQGGRFEEPLVYLEPPVVQEITP